MKIKSSIIKIGYLLTFVFLFSCDSEVKETIDKKTELLPNGKRLIVEKTNKETTQIGIFSKHNYGTSHTFKYKISINPGDINWDGGNGEPKHLLFCEDTIYMRSFKEKSVRVEYNDSIDNKEEVKYHYEIKEVFQKHIDERYFFKLFGDDYWIDISQEEYTSKIESCNQYIIPNDNELSLKSISNN